MLRKLLPTKTICALIVCSAALAGCAPTNVIVTTEPETPAVGPIQGSPPIQSWYAEVRDVVSRELRVDLSDVALSVTDTNGIATHAKTSLMGALEHDLDNTRFAESLVDNILTLQTESVLAIYAPSVKKILLHSTNLEKYLNKRTGGAKEALQALLIHELVHAADDQNHQAFKQDSMSYQEVFAKSAVIEGHAQWQTRRICKNFGCENAFAQLNNYMFDSGSPEDPALKYVQSRSFKNLEFVYKEGERFIDKLQQRNNSAAMVSLAFNKPPRDSIQIIDPDSFPNRERERRNDTLSEIIEASTKPWQKNSTGSLKRNVLAAAAFSVDPSARQPIVNFYTSKILAATKHEYYEHGSDTPIPVAVIALQTDSATTARKTAALIFNSTLSTYDQLKGELVEIRDWKREHHSAEFENRHAVRNTIEVYSASGYINNGLVNAEYPVEIITATSGNYLIHIDGRYVHGQKDLMQFAGRLLLAMRNLQGPPDARLANLSR